VVAEDLKPLPITKAMGGVDRGVKDGGVWSTGETIANPPHLPRSARQLAHAHRTLARTRKGSKNPDKARLKVGRVHAKVAAQRAEGLQKVTTRLMRENQVSCIEAWAVKNRVRTHALARSSSDVGGGELVHQVSRTT